MPFLAGRFQPVVLLAHQPVQFDEAREHGVDLQISAGDRIGLLGVNGIGPETADDMLLYAFERPVFVVDAYTRRVFGRLGMLNGGEGYEFIRLGVETALGPDVALFNEYHALIVRHAKTVCRVRPDCGQCVLAQYCAVAGELG